MCTDYAIGYDLHNNRKEGEHQTDHRHRIRHLRLVLLAIGRQSATWQAPGVAIAWQMAGVMEAPGTWRRLTIWYRS